MHPRLKALVESIRRLFARRPRAANDDLARSKAERALYEMLESWPETTGLFELNGKLDFRFGPRLAEVDLLCRALRIAIEVDGFFHFQSDEAYRRDREKDWELQRHGYLVLRFLAADILPQIVEIRDRVFAAVASLSRSKDL